VASTIATSDGRPDPAQSVRHDRAVLPSGCSPHHPKEVWRPSVAARRTRTAGLPPVYGLL